MRYLPPKYYEDGEREQLIEFAGYWLRSGELRLETAALLFLRAAERPSARNIPICGASWSWPGPFPPAACRSPSSSTGSCPGRGRCEPLPAHPVRSGHHQRGVLDNLKTATPWMVKSVGVELLRTRWSTPGGAYPPHLHHFSNLIKVSERVVVRHDAGAGAHPALLRREQRNEVVVELGRDWRWASTPSPIYPQYLGQAALYLYPSELDEQVLWLKNLLGSQTIRRCPAR